MSWERVKLGNFLKVRDDRFKPDDKAISTLKRIDKIDFSGEIYISDKPSNTDMILIKKGDLVISGINVEKGAMAIYRGEEDITATIHYSSYSFDEKKIDIDFLKYFLKSIEFKNALKEQVPGGIKTEIKPKHLLPLLVAIPTEINDQKSVVRLLQSRNAKVDAISSELTYQLSLVKKLRQQLLQDTIQGKLNTQNIKDEPSIVLLKQIKTPQPQLQVSKKTKKKKEPLSTKDQKNPFIIPANWIWSSLGEISLYSEAGKSYQAQEVSAQADQIGVIKTSAITTGFFLEDENKLLPNQNVNIDKIKIERDDIIFCRASGSKGLAGKSCYVINTPKSKLILSDKSIRYVFHEKISKKFIQYYNSSVFAEEYYQKLGTGKSTSMNNITREQFNNLPIPLPPFNEQLRIVQKLEDFMQACNILEASIKTSSLQNENLLQQILKEALQNRTDKI